MSKLPQTDESVHRNEKGTKQAYGIWWQSQKGQSALWRKKDPEKDMTPEQEIARIKRDFKEHWSRLENHPEIQTAIKANNPIKLGEVAARLAYGNVPSKADLEQGQADSEYYENLKRREKMIEARKNQIEHLS